MKQVVLGLCSLGWLLSASGCGGASHCQSGSKYGTQCYDESGNTLYDSSPQPTAPGWQHTLPPEAPRWEPPPATAPAPEPAPYD